tara:strand:- start:120 stop:311 length:192 start_codon:yes stop_codon:yes gene_type:complete
MFLPWGKLAPLSPKKEKAHAIGPAQMPAHSPPLLRSIHAPYANTLPGTGNASHGNTGAANAML